MNKTMFLDELKKYLKRLPTDEVEDILNYYNEYFDECESEEVAISKLQPPKQIAGKLIAESSINELTSKDKSKRRISLATLIFALLSAPITIPFCCVLILFIGLGIMLLGLGFFTLILFCFAITLICFFTFIAIIPSFGLTIGTGFYVLGIFCIELAICITIYCVSKYAIINGYHGIKKMISKLVLRRYKPCPEKK